RTQLPRHPPSPATMATDRQPEPPRPAETPPTNNHPKSPYFQGKRDRPRSPGPPCNPKAAGSNPARPIQRAPQLPPSAKSSPQAEGRGHRTVTSAAPLGPD